MPNIRPLSQKYKDSSPFLEEGMQNSNNCSDNLVKKIVEQIRDIFQEWHYNKL